MKEWAEAFYKGGRWLRTRERYLEHSGGMCEECSTDDDPVPATIVHHRVELTPENIHDPAVGYGFANLEGVCQGCHNRIHHGGKSSENPTREGLCFGKDGQPVPRE